MYKDSKWAKELLALQDQDGLWGYFHSLSGPSKLPLTTEQALRRLMILGFTIEDEPIERTVAYMDACLAGKRQMPDRTEKTHDWTLFTNLMLSTWIRKFTDRSDRANAIAKTWAGVISDAFAGGAYKHVDYVASYQSAFGIKPLGARFEDFASFYQVSLIANMLDEKTEAAVFDYLLHYRYGIYYIYDKPIGKVSIVALPEAFESKQASRYLAAIEILAGYKRNLGKLHFVLEWLEESRNENGLWDMGSSARDGVYFPLSDSWKREADREKDCTYRIQKLIGLLTDDRP